MPTGSFSLPLARATTMPVSGQSRRLLAGYRYVASTRHESAVRIAWFEDIIDYQNDNLTSNSRVRTTQAQAEHTFTFKPACASAARPNILRPKYMAMPKCSRAHGSFLPRSPQRFSL